MTTQTNTATKAPVAFNMNVTRGYVPNWTAHDVMREYASNTVDYDGVMTELATDRMQFCTDSQPTLDNLVAIGSGSSDDSKIGQWREGSKMAAMVVARAGGVVTVWFGHYKLEYKFLRADGLDEETLHCIVETLDEYVDGCVTVVQMDNISNCSFEFLGKDYPIGPIKKDDLSPCRVHMKGVFIGVLSHHSIYDWNLSDLQINRDRNLVDSYSVFCSISDWLEDNEDIDDVLIEATAGMEVDGHISPASYVEDRLREKWVKHFGEMAVASYANIEDMKARISGYAVIDCSELMKNCAVPTAYWAEVDSEALVGELQETDPQLLPSEMVKLENALAKFLWDGLTIRFFDNYIGDNVVLDLSNREVWIYRGSIYAPQNANQALMTLLYSIEKFNDRSLADLGIEDDEEIAGAWEEDKRRVFNQVSRMVGELLR
jgi:hypothetical protein